MAGEKGAVEREIEMAGDRARERDGEEQGAWERGLSMRARAHERDSGKGRGDCKRKKKKEKRKTTTGATRYPGQDFLPPKKMTQQTLQ